MTSETGNGPLLMPMKKLLASLPLICAVCFIFTSSSNVKAQGEYQYHVVGNGEDVKTETSGGLALAGGGKDVDAAFQWMITKSGGGDFVVIRASGTDAYNPYIKSLGKLDSVETLIIKSRRAASDSFVINKIRNAEALFIAGGDQANYINFWKGTPVAAAIQSLIARNVPIGGSSAGLAVLGEFLFPALFDTITSKEALENPFNERLVLDRHFLNLPQMKGLITDSHFVERDRMGRLIAFLARLKNDGWVEEARAIAIDKETAVLIEADGKASLAGKNAAYFLRANTQPEVCAKDRPLSYRNISVYKISGVATFDLRNWRGKQGIAYSLSVEKGSLISTQAKGQIY
jgi:cyanophycinase